MPESNEKKTSNKRKILLPIIAIAVVLVLIFAIILPAKRSAAYKHANALMEEGNYAEAKAEYEKLSPYMESAWKASACENYIAAEEIYAEAMEKYNAGNWTAAEEKFKEIQKLESSWFHEAYKDTKELADSCQNHQKYDEAMDLMSHEDNISDVKKAAEKFTDLGSFEDSKDKAAACQELIEKEETYQEAQETLDRDDYAGAKEIFDRLGDYKDSAEKSEACSIMTDYEAAVALFDAGEYKKALEGFETLESTYKSAGNVVKNFNSKYTLEAMKNRSQAEVDLAGAEKLFKDGDYAGAAEKLSGIDINMLTLESLDRKNEIENTIKLKEKYDKAMKYYNGGQFYEAYKAFNNCGSYSDAAEMAKKCIQPFPATGVVYMNEAYGDRSCELTINNSGYKNAYYKLYLGGDLVLTVFIPENGSATFMLPAGNYKMTKGYGDTWFGTEDLFGDDGRYWVCSFGGSETAPLEAGYAYEISSGGEGTGIGTESSDRNSI